MGRMIRFIGLLCTVNVKVFFPLLLFVCFLAQCLVHIKYSKASTVVRTVIVIVQAQGTCECSYQLIYWCLPLILDF